MATPNLNGDRLIRPPLVDAKANYLGGFRQWVEVLAADDCEGAPEALYWPGGKTGRAPGKVEERIATFWGGDKPRLVGAANERLVGLIDDAAEFQSRNAEGRGWFVARVRVTTAPADPRGDEIPLAGAADSFAVRRLDERYILGHEIIHV
jgi:hypothetical protein